MKTTSILAAAAAVFSSAVSAATIPSYIPPVGLVHVATNYMSFDLNQFHRVDSAQGSTYNIAILSGNWTTPNGKLLANVLLGGYNGEIDFVDNNAVSHVDQHYTLEWADDKTLALVSFQAMGTIQVGSTGTVTVLTESKNHAFFNDQIFLAPAYFINNNSIVQNIYQQSFANTTAAATKPKA